MAYSAAIWSDEMFASLLGAYEEALIAGAVSLDADDGLRQVDLELMDRLHRAQVCIHRLEQLRRCDGSRPAANSAYGT